MDRREASLGIDLGTSGVKVVLVDAQGAALAAAARSFAVSSPCPGWAETPPAQWAEAARAAVAEVLSQCPGVRVVTVGIDGQMHGVVLVRSATPVRNAVLWPDSRADAELSLWRDVPEAVRATLANPLTAGMAGPVLAWLARHEPEAIQAADTMVAPKDWLRMQLVPGEPVTDPSDASATLLWDVVAHDWCAPVVAAAGIEARLLPRVWPSTEPVGTLAPADASSWGLPADIPVSVGCGDAAATLVGAGPASDQLIVTLGTGIQVLSPGTEPRADAIPRHHTFASATGDYYAMAAPMNGGWPWPGCVSWPAPDGPSSTAPSTVIRARSGRWSSCRISRPSGCPVPSRRDQRAGTGWDWTRAAIPCCAARSNRWHSSPGVRWRPCPGLPWPNCVWWGAAPGIGGSSSCWLTCWDVRYGDAVPKTSPPSARPGWAAQGHEVTGAGMELEEPLAPGETFDYDPRFDRFQELTEELVG